MYMEAMASLYGRVGVHVLLELFIINNYSQLDFIVTIKKDKLVH